MVDIIKALLSAKNIEWDLEVGDCFCRRDAVCKLSSDDSSQASKIREKGLKVFHPNISNDAFTHRFMAISAGADDLIDY